MHIGEIEMIKKTGPYIGVTGFMSRGEVSRALSVVPKNSKYRLMVGLLMSSKTLKGRQNKWPGRYPKAEDVADIFVNDYRALNLIHYNTDEPMTLQDQLLRITDIAGPNLDGFQLNLAWPSVSEIEDYATIHPDKFLLLQIGSMAMVEAGSIERFVDMVSVYQPFIDAILIDPSGGYGKPLDSATGAEYLRAIPKDWGLGLGIAGGLGPNTMHLLGPLPEEFPGLSIDAEGRLRTPMPEDALSIRETQVYLEQSFEMLM